MAILEITIRDRVGVVRRPEFADLVAYENAKRSQDDFSAKRSLFKRINAGSESLPGAYEVSVAAAALRNAGDEMVLVELEEDDLSPETAELYAAALEKCVPHAFGVGDVQVVCKAPASDVVQVYYKASDTNVTSASRALCEWCMRVGPKGSSEALVKRIDERYPAAWVGLANQLAQLGGLTATAEVRER